VNEVTTRSLVVACVFNDGQVVWFMGVVDDASVTDDFCRVVSSCYAIIWCWMYLVVSQYYTYIAGTVLCLFRWRCGGCFHTPSTLGMFFP
jgi:hypothetical protein